MRTIRNARHSSYVRANRSQTITETVYPTTPAPLEENEDPWGDFEFPHPLVSGDPDYDMHGFIGEEYIEPPPIEVLRRAFSKPKP